jgi:hypothetical protein
MLQEQLLAHMDINQRAVLIVFLGMIAASGAARLYDKAGQPFWHALVPGLNLVALMRIIGRPETHALWVLVPGANVYFVARWFIELAQSFGKTHWLDYVLVVLFNAFYVLNLGLAYSEEYEGPVYQKRTGAAFA